MMMEMVTSLPTRNDVMGKNENNSQLIQLLCTFNISEKPVCCQDSMVRHDEAEIMLSSYMLYDIKEGTHRVRIFYVKTHLFSFSDVMILEGYCESRCPVRKLGWYRHQ